jgi:Leucine-rich repeat (LRR) protein
MDLSSLKLLRILQLQYNRLHELPQLRLLGLEDLNLAHNQLTTLKGTEQLILLKKIDLS